MCAALISLATSFLRGGYSNLNATTMHDLQTINDIVSTAVKNSSYVTVIISSCVFIIYTLIIKVVDYFKSKNRSKPMIEMANAIKLISYNAQQRYDLQKNKVLDKTFKDAEVKETGRVTNVINVGFKAFRSTIYEKICDILVRNHIAHNEDSTKSNIYKIVNTEYYKLFSVLSAYEINGINVASKLRDEWIDNIDKEIIDVVFSEDDNLTKFNRLSSKLEIITEDYSVRVNNKVFNH